MCALLIHLKGKTTTMYHRPPSSPPPFLPSSLACSLSCLLDVARHVSIKPLWEQPVYTVYAFPTFFLLLTFFRPCGRHFHLLSVKCSTMYPSKPHQHINVACYVALNPLPERIVYTLYVFLLFFLPRTFFL